MNLNNEETLQSPKQRREVERAYVWRMRVCKVEGAGLRADMADEHLRRE